MKKSKTNRRVNKSVDHGICYCLSCDIEKGEQYIKLKYPKAKQYNEIDPFNLMRELLNDAGSVTLKDTDLT